jgi:uncharacterized cupredoxin-like copper-binding protein
MLLAGAGCWALGAAVAGFLLYSGLVYAPGVGDSALVAKVLPVFASAAVILGVLGTLALVWPGARHHAAFWLVPVVLALLLQVLNAQDTPYDLARPANPSPFLITIVALGGSVAAIVGGLVAFLEARRRRPVWVGSGRVGWLSMVAIGMVIGAALTSVQTSRSSVYGAALGEAPTTTQVMTVEDLRFVDSRIAMRHDQVLGLFVVNPTSVGHSFDIDGLGIHVLLPPNSTTAVTIQSTEPASLEFYCSVHGHRAAGMAGTLTIE